jgi:hypothetical protein
MPVPTIKLRPPMNQAAVPAYSTVNSDGTITVANEPEMVEPLIVAGYRPVSAPGAESKVTTVTGVPCSTTAATYGTASVISADSGFAAMVPLSGLITFTGTISSETITARILATFDDGSTVSVTKTATQTGTTELGSADLRTLAKDGLNTVSLSIAAQSNGSASAALVNYSMHGLNR